MNPTESELRALLEANGYRVLRGGWPDFYAIPPDGGPGIAIEVKAGGDGLREHQKEMHQALEAAGIPVLTVKPEKKTSKAPLNDYMREMGAKGGTAAAGAGGRKHWANVSAEERSSKMTELIKKRWGKGEPTDFFREMGKIGGQAGAERRWVDVPPEARSEAGRKAAQARWGKSKAG